ncbi:MAG: hypothetical protein HY002_09860 [Candidatus Rokubacteria bacterium]|nr:hypothetical protein [Candidatus Rokubacteria bacterium]
MTTRTWNARTRFLGVALGMVGVIVAGCGGKSGSSTGPSTSSSSTLKSLEVTVVTAPAAQAPSRFGLARLADLLGWPQVAEASHCTVSAPGVSGTVTATTGPDEKATLTGVAVGSGGTIPVTINCVGGGGGSVTLTGGVPGAIVRVTVEVTPGKIEVKVKNQKVSQPSKPSKPSKISQKKKV